MKKWMVSANFKWVLGAVLVLVVGGWGWWKYGAGQVNAVKDGEVIIKMTEDGFKPDHIHIKKGTKVRFVNKDKVFHWPASDFHPTHGLYPEFDPRVPIAMGKEWDFV